MRNLLNLSPDEYSLHLTYDANGNIETFIRNPMTPLIKMDDMSYKYAQTTTDHYGHTKKTNNRLAHIRDAAGDLAGIADVIDQGAGYDPNTTSTHNYQYDARGRITSDKAKGIELIEYTVYNKVKKVYYSTASGKPDVPHPVRVRNEVRVALPCPHRVGTWRLRHAYDP